LSPSSFVHFILSRVAKVKNAVSLLAYLGKNRLKNGVVTFVSNVLAE